MIFTLAWKEVREHQGIWLTMVFMTVVLGIGLAKIVSLNDDAMAAPVAAFTILGLAATYGVVCGSMMFAGEHEGGTLVFLDIFLGRRGVLWAEKFGIGFMLVLAQSAAVAVILGLLDWQPPRWTLSLIGHPGAMGPGGAVRVDAWLWTLLLPVVTLEAYCWGLLGSSLTTRVLAGAAVGAVGFTPVWLFALLAQPTVFLGFRLVLALILLAISAATFLNQSRETAAGPAPPAEPDGFRDLKDEFLDRFDRFERKDRRRTEPAPEEPLTAPAASRAALNDAGPPIAKRSSAEFDQAESPHEVLWWLTLQQAKPLLWIIGAVCLVVGFVFVPVNVQVLWPLATLLLGVACGTAVFAPEQRELSYEFLAAQHFPLRLIWRFKIAFWLAAAVIAALLLAVGTFTVAGFVGRPLGTLHDLMGPIGFFGVWLAYGFGAGQLVVWYCRKNILALLVSSMVAAGMVSIWLPSLLCGGMGSWQVWGTPLIGLTATCGLTHAWAGGRVYERKPLAALTGFGAAAILFALLCFAQRAWQIPDVGMPIDVDEFRAALPDVKDNDATSAIQRAAGNFGGPEADWLKPMADAARLPLGVIEKPRSDGLTLSLTHLPNCKKIKDALLDKAANAQPDPAMEYLVLVLALSRNLRNKAPLESYLDGVKAEEDALAALDKRLAPGKTTAAQLRRALNELNRHSDETPPPLDCLRTECFISAGLLANPSAWSFNQQLPERWLAGSVVLSFETPWEEERKMRLWQHVWAGLFRAIETPHWELPKDPDEFRTQKPATREILQAWLPAPEGPGASWTRAHTVRLLESSWLADDRLFCSAEKLRAAATRARWRVDAARQALALGLHRLEAGKSAQDLHELVPKVLRELPIDPYSGQLYRYRVGPGGQLTLWSTGPDGTDDGGINHGGHIPDGDPRWTRGGFDLIVQVPDWR